MRVPQGPARNPLDALIEQVRNGAPGAVAALCEGVQQPLLQRIRWMMGQQARLVAESGDFLQETLAAALPALHQFEVEDGRSLLRWLTAIARNRIRNDVRRQRERALSVLSSTVLGRVGAGTSQTPDLESLMTLAEALEALNPADRDLVEGRDLEGRSFAEIGAKLGCSERQAHRLHAAAILRLSRALRNAGPSP